MTHLRCGYFFSNLMGDRLMSSQWSGRQVQAVHGPEDLTHTRVAEVLSHATGRKIRLDVVTDEDVRRSLLSAGMGERTVEGTIGMSRGLGPEFTPEQPRSLRTTTPTSSGKWAYANLRPALRQ